MNSIIEAQIELKHQQLLLFLEKRIIEMLKEQREKMIDKSYLPLITKR